MANEVSGINMIVEVGSTAINAQSSATLTSTPELAEAIVKGTNYTQQVSGDQEWSLSYEGQIEDESGEHALANGNAKIGVGVPVAITAVDTTNDIFTLAEDKSSSWSSGDTLYVIDSTGNDQEYTINTISGTDVTVSESISDSTADGDIFKPETVPGLQNFTLSGEQDLNDVPPGVDEQVGWKNYVPLRRTWAVEAEGHYYDPANDSTYETIHTARDNGNNLGAVLTIMGADFTGYIAADGLDIEAGTDDNAAYSLSWAGSDVLEQFGTVESSVQGIIDLYFNQNTGTVGLRHEKDGTVVTGSTLWKGDAHLSSMEMELARNEFPTISTDFQGDGKLERVTQ